MYSSNELLALERVDAVITDLPCGIGTAKAKANSSISDNESGGVVKAWDDKIPEHDALFQAIVLDTVRNQRW